MSTEKKLVPIGTLDKLNAVAAASAMEIEDDTRPIDVNMGRLIGGVSLIFAGVLRLLSALDVEDTHAMPCAGAEGAAGATPAPESEPADGAEDDHTEDDGGSTPENSGIPACTEPPAKNAISEDEASSEPVQPPVTADDITKVIVRKIKQNRSNTQKIGSILKTFGVSKVSELPAGQYEAFLTELAQL